MELSFFRKGVGMGDRTWDLARSPEVQGPLRCASVTERNGRGALRRARPQPDGLGSCGTASHTSGGSVGPRQGGDSVAAQAAPLEARKGSLGVAAGAGHSRQGGTFGSRTHVGEGLQGPQAASVAVWGLGRGASLSPRPGLARLRDRAAALLL